MALNRPGAESTIEAMTLSGVFAPLPTPIDDEDHVDTARLRASFPRWLASPLAGFVVLGTNGEAGLLDQDESDAVVAEARAQVPRGRWLIAGAGRESTGGTIAAARRAATLGADAVLVRTPSFFKPQMTADAFACHYTAVADASPVPVLLYNFSAATGVNLAPATAVALAQHPNIVGIKESGSDIAHIGELVSTSPQGFSVLAGSASTFHAALCAGVDGGILALAALLPEACVAVFALAAAKRYDEAREAQRKLLPIARLISTYGVPGLKAALQVVGCDLGRPRPPLLRVSESNLALFRSALMPFEEVTV